MATCNCCGQPLPPVQLERGDVVRFTVSADHNGNVYEYVAVMLNKDEVTDISYGRGIRAVVGISNKNGERGRKYLVYARELTKVNTTEFEYWMNRVFFGA